MTIADTPVAHDDLVVTCSHANERAVVRVAGDLDAYTSIKLRRVLDDCLQLPVTSIECDLAGVTFIDSGGLGLLVSARRRADSAHVRFGMVDPARCVQRLFDVTGMAERLLA